MTAKIYPAFEWYDESGAWWLRLREGEPGSYSLTVHECGTNNSARDTDKVLDAVELPIEAWQAISEMVERMTTE